MVKTKKQDITKAIQFNNTFRYIDDLFSANNVDFGNYISAIYPSELELKDTSTSSTEVCYVDTNNVTSIYWLYFVPVIFRQQIDQSVEISANFMEVL